MYVASGYRMLTVLDGTKFCDVPQMLDTFSRSFTLFITTVLEVGTRTEMYRKQGQSIVEIQRVCELFYVAGSTS